MIAGGNRASEVIQHLRALFADGNPRRAQLNLNDVLDESIALVLIDDEGEVEIVRRLADEIDLLLFEQLECGAELMQDRANIASDETYGCARSDDLNTAELRERLNERSQTIGIECICLRVERDSDVRLGGRDQIHGHTVILKDLESIGDEADLMPHAGAVHRNQRDALLDADGLDLRRAIAGRC